MNDWIATGGVRPDLPDGTLLGVRVNPGYIPYPGAEPIEWYRDHWIDIINSYRLASRPAVQPAEEDWTPCDRPPSVPGVYERTFPGLPPLERTFQLWNGVQWGLCATTPEEAGSGTFTVSLLQTGHWRRAQGNAEVVQQVVVSDNSGPVFAPAAAPAPVQRTLGVSNCHKHGPMLSYGECPACQWESPPPTVKQAVAGVRTGPADSHPFLSLPVERCRELTLRYIGRFESPQRKFGQRES